MAGFLKRTGWLPGLILLLIFSGPARAEITAGGGMEFYSMKILANELDGRYYHSLLQTTLAVARVGFEQEPFYVMVSGGISDWNVSGEWQGTDIGTYNNDPFYWAWQQELEVEGGCRVWGPFLLGAQYADHALEHYEGLSHRVFMRVRTRAASFLGTWEFVKTKDLDLSLTLAYAPQASLELYQDFYFYGLDYSFAQNNGAGTGPCGRGRIRMRYHDSAGWGLDLAYQLGWLRIPEAGDVQNVSLKAGSLSGCFLFNF